MFNATVPANTGCYISVVDIGRFVPADVFTRKMETWMDRIKASKVRPGFSEVIIPGEIENRKLADQGEELLLLDKTWQELYGLARA